MEIVELESQILIVTADSLGSRLLKLNPIMRSTLRPSYLHSELIEEFSLSVQILAILLQKIFSSNTLIAFWGFMCPISTVGELIMMLINWARLNSFIAWYPPKIFATAFSSSIYQIEFSLLSHEYTGFSFPEILYCQKAKKSFTKTG